MITTRQCEIARYYMNSTKPSVEMLAEYNSIDRLSALIAAHELDTLLRKNNKYLEQGYEAVSEEFDIISAEYKISPELLLCLLME